MKASRPGCVREVSAGLSSAAHRSSYHRKMGGKVRFCAGTYLILFDLGPSVAFKAAAELPVASAGGDYKNYMSAINF